MNIEQLQEQISDMQEDIKRLTKMNELLSGKIFNILNSINELSDRIDDCESNISSGF